MPIWPHPTLGGGSFPPPSASDDTAERAARRSSLRAGSVPRNEAAGGARSVGAVEARVDGRRRGRHVARQLVRRGIVRPVDPGASQPLRPPHAVPQLPPPRELAPLVGELLKLGELLLEPVRIDR